MPYTRVEFHASHGWCRNTNVSKLEPTETARAVYTENVYRAMTIINIIRNNRRESSAHRNRHVCVCVCVGYEKKTPPHAGSFTPPRGRPVQLIRGPFSVAESRADRCRFWRAPSGHGGHTPVPSAVGRDVCEGVRVAEVTEARIL